MQNNHVKYVLWKNLCFFSLSQAGFWAALGGKKDYQTSKTLQKIVKPPRLFACSNKTGRLIVSIYVFICFHSLRGYLLYFDTHDHICFLKHIYLTVVLYSHFINVYCLIFRQRRCPVTSHRWIWLPMMSWFWTPGIRYAAFTFNETIQWQFSYISFLLLPNP